MDNNTPICFLNDYIKALILNVDREKIHKKINLVFDSGALNGIYGMGAALYIHHLAKLGYIKVKKVSGCSIGSLIGLWYICGCPDFIYPIAENLFAYFKNHKNFFLYKQVVTAVVQHLFPTDDAIKLINGRLYINYYDTKKCKQCVITRFKNRTHLITCILRSGHVPFISNGKHKYAGRYVDGIVPTFFKKKITSSRQNLFISLFTLNRPTSAFKITNEQNIYTRLIKGVVEANDFYMNSNSDICKYVDDKNYLIHFQLYMRECFILFILALIEAIIIIHHKIPVCIRDSFLYNRLASIIIGNLGFIQNNLN